jgi:AraC family transcriptional regulator, arabinose operon regulatory protein
MDNSVFNEIRGDNDMIDISGHLREFRREIGFEDTEHNLSINCCGYQRFRTKNFSCKRPNGRLDYQIIYIYKGCGHYLINGEVKTVTAGNILVFPPNVPQVYSYYAIDSPEVFWIHFTGSDCKQLIDNHQLCSGNIGENLPIKTLFQDIILELQLKRPLFETVIINDFNKLLTMIERSQLLRNNHENRSSMDHLIIQLNHHYMDAWTISSMAECCSLSKDYFAHCFKKLMGISPMQFLTDLRMDKAKELLQDEELNISAIATLVGYEDPLYFSRVFKKTTGLSPKSYYKTIG